MNEESRLYWFTPNPAQDRDSTAEFRLAGLLLGLAVYNSVILDLHLPLALYKKLMGIEVGLPELKQLDPVNNVLFRWLMIMCHDYNYYLLFYYIGNLATGTQS